MEDADFIIPIVIDNQVHNVYVLKRPGVDNFMRRMGEIYEIVVFTASLATVRNLVLLVFVYTFWYIFPGAIHIEGKDHPKLEYFLLGSIWKKKQISRNSLAHCISVC